MEKEVGDGDRMRDDECGENRERDRKREVGGGGKIIKLHSKRENTRD